MNVFNVENLGKSSFRKLGLPRRELVSTILYTMLMTFEYTQASNYVFHGPNYIPSSMSNCFIISRVCSKGILVYKGYNSEGCATQFENIIIILGKGKGKDLSPYQVFPFPSHHVGPGGFSCAKAGETYRTCWRILLLRLLFFFARFAQGLLRRRA